MQPITVHMASAQDASAIAQMARELAAFEGEQTLANEASVRSILAGHGEPRCRCVVAKDGDNSVAFALYYAGYDLSSASYGFHLADIYVRPPYRGQGVGKKLLAYIAAQAEEEERQWISLTALRENAAAKGFYEALGFHQAGVNFYAIGASGLVKIRD